MTYEQIVAMMQTYYVNADASMTTGHYAVQVNVIGEGEGAFYIEIAEGKVNVQPFDYVDRNAAVNAAAESLMAIAEGKVSYTEAVNGSQITIEGDAEAAAVLDSIKVAAKEVAEVTAEPVAEKTAEVVAEPVAEKAAEVVAEPVAEKAAEVVAEPVAEKAAEVVKPAAKKAPAKKAPARKRAVSKAASNAKGTKSSKKAAK